MYSEKQSYAQVTPKASSICAYLFSVSDIDIEAKATDFQVPSDFWKRTAPKPYEDASAETLVGTVGLYNTSTVGLVNSYSIWVNACSWIVPQTHDCMLSTQQFTQWLTKLGQVRCELSQLISHAQKQT